MVKTKSDGGFGSRISSTRWNRYGTFSAKFKSGATGPGIVTAMMLSNPLLQEEISIEITGRDPKTVITDLYRQQYSVIHNRRHPVDNVKEEDSTSSSSAASSSPLSEEKKSVEENSHGMDDENSLEETHTLKRSMTENEVIYKIEWTPEMIRWSVDGQVLRTLTAKELFDKKGYGLPTDPMMLQLTIWDGGYDRETDLWSGGKTDYGEWNQKEYRTEVEWIEIVCRDPKEAKKQHPWPGPDASKRLLEQIEAETVQKEKERKGQEGSDDDEVNAEDSQENRKEKSGGIFSVLMDSLLRVLLRWTLILLVIVGSASYLTDPSRGNGQRTKKALALKQ
ncbi:hypothetical protein BGX28_003926 [Mortierella sp. GBA30]|nr:hypothetical protein BGX28_003926 [Mortierella sp. GBA30]